MNLQNLQNLQKIMMNFIMIFWKDEVAQNDGDFWGYFLFKQIYYIFT